MDAPTHLHNDVKGKVEQQVANGDGQKVGGEVVGSLYEAVGRSTERKREDDVIIQSCTVHFFNSYRLYFSTGRNRLFTHRDQLTMFPITSRTIRSCQTHRRGKIIYKHVMLTWQ